ncbi:MAG TPA: MFS transporter [Solirubrobacteraceae bacterium]|nr:MFS transporter [Solirubrobacteraceae bacterium]
MNLRSLAPLRHRGFRLLVGGQLASNLGDAFYAVALPWYVLASHGGALRLGEVLAAYGIARAAGLGAGGHVSDRLTPPRAMLGADLTRAVALAALAAVAAGSPMHLALVIPVAILAGAGEGIFLPASFAVVPTLLPDDDLQAGNALSSGGTQLATLAGPALGGALVALAGPAPAFAIDAGSFLVSALSLFAIRSAAPPAQPIGAAPHVDSGPEALGLWQIIRSEPIVLLIFAINIAANLGSGGMSEVALPALAHGPLRAGPTGYGVLVASLAGGALLGTLMAAHAGRPRRPAIVATLAFLIESGFMAAVPYLGGAPAAAAALACFGVCNGFANVLTITAFQRWAPPGLLGRLLGFIMLGSFGIFPVSVLIGGFVVHGFGAAIFFPLAAATLAVTLLFAVSRAEWRRFGARSAGGSAAAGWSR